MDIRRWAPLLSRAAVACAALALSSCGGAASEVATVPPSGSPQAQADAFLAAYNPELLRVYTEASNASWAASTDVSEAHTAGRTAADLAFVRFCGASESIEAARTLLQSEDELNDLTVRQLRAVLELAASGPMTNPELSDRRVEAESEQAARLDGFPFCLARADDGECPEDQRISTNQIDRVLVESTDLDERRRYWDASKEVGGVLRDGLIELRGLRNGVAQEMGHEDFVAFQVSNYGMTTPEMMALLDRLVQETRPLYQQVHCWVRHELAERYDEEPPGLIPAHWIGNRWAQSWPGLVDGVDLDALLEDKEPEWIVEQAERFYVSMGFPELPESFYERSDLYPVPEGEARDKNDHASAWHVDLRQDVRSLMSVEPNWRWFTTTHHELGHIYYYIAYTRDEVPPLLRGGANRSFHEGIGSLIALASSQRPYLEAINLLDEDDEIDEVRWLLDSALTGPIVFLPFSAGTMSHFETALYAEDLPAEQFNAAWWEMVARYQGVAPPSDRAADGCDACTKTHINDDPGQYYDYALSEVLLYQLHDHICRNIVEADPRACNYYDREDVGAFLRRVLEVGATVDWREHLREMTGRDLTAEPMLEYYRPLSEFLARENEGRDCSWPGE